MANPEHLKILKQGVKVWNKWRRERPYISLNLSEANLSEADLSEANLNEANLFEANLSEADLSEANLSEANLTRGNLKGANLNGANLNGTNLFFARLIQTNLTNSDLFYSTLIFTDLTEATLTGTKLYGSSRDNWCIKGVKCDYIYWEPDLTIRSPIDRDFAPGEFEQIYSTLPMIEYVFQNGMLPIDPLIMDRVVQTIRENKPDFDIKIDSINARGLAPSIKFTVQKEEYKEPALKEIIAGYEARIQLLEAERDRYWQKISSVLDEPKRLNLVTAAPGSTVAIATDGSTINIEQHIHYVTEIQKAIAKEPEKSKSFLKIAKEKALDIVGEALEDIAKGELKKAAKDIYELGKLVGPLIAKTAAYAYFKGMIGI